MPSMLLAQLPLFPGMALLPFEFGFGRCHVTDDHFDFAIVCRYSYISFFETERRYADFRHSVYFLLGCTHVILLSGTLNCTHRGQTWILGTGSETSKKLHSTMRNYSNLVSEKIRIYILPVCVRWCSDVYSALKVAACRGWSTLFMW